MKKMAVAIMGVFVAGGALAAPPDWSKVPARKMTLFYPGQASLEWIMNKADHSSADDIVKKNRGCTRCHDSDANEIGDKIIKGQPVGNSKSVLEPNPISGKVGWLAATFQAAHDGNKIYFRFEFPATAVTGKKLDDKNEVKLTMMFDGGGTVDGANLNGCWATCHTDLRSMKDAKDDKKTKYIKDANLDGGKFMDLMQWRSGKGEKPVDGHVTSERTMTGGAALTKAEGKKEGDKWVVTFERDLAAKAKGDHSIVAGKTYNFGFAVHESHSNARYHYVSLGYQFGLDQDQAGVKNYINVQKQ